MKSVNYNKAVEYIHKQWLRKSLLSTVLYPISCITRFLLFLKKTLYKLKLLKIFKVKIPVVVVGNIYIGGTGKTPVVISIIKELESRGWKPGVVSRGYGVQVGNSANVGCKNLDFSKFGDEPVLITKKTGAPVSVHPKRYIAIRDLLRYFPNIDIIISDDGLQHTAMGRDFEIIVQDNRKLGNGRLIPSGPLRESSSRLNQVNVIINNIENYEEFIEGNIDFDFQKTQPYIINMYLKPEFAHNISRLEQDRPVSHFNCNSYHKKIVAISGIGNNERFIKTLNGCMIYPSSHIQLKDHFEFNNFSFHDIAADAILMTSKDAVKCTKYKDARLWEISISAKFSNGKFFDYLSNHMYQINMKLKDHL